MGITACASGDEGTQSSVPSSHWIWSFYHPSPLDRLRSSYGTVPVYAVKGPVVIWGEGEGYLDDFSEEGGDDQGRFGCEVTSDRIAQLRRRMSSNRSPIMACAMTFHTSFGRSKWPRLIEFRSCLPASPVGPIVPSF
jgi:hypothetical protein